MHIKDILFGYFSGNLSETEERELLQWLEADESHTKLLSEMADWWAIAHVPLYASDMKKDFEKHFGYLKENTINKKTSYAIKMWSKIAASVLLLVSVGTLSYFVGKIEKERDEKIAYFETITPMGTHSKVVLPDQTVVWMNAGSSLKYAKDFDYKKREVILNGEAYFEVKPDSVNLFIVKSEMLDIRVLGTHFNVKAYKEEQVTDVALVSGKVDVHLIESSLKSKGVILTPDRMLSFNKETKCVKVSECKSEDAHAWTDGYLRFTEQPFEQITRDLERKFNVHIQIASKTLRKEVFSGSFSSDYSLNEILQEVDVDHKYTWKRDGNEIIIRDK